MVGVIGFPLRLALGRGRGVVLGQRGRSRHGERGGEADGKQTIHRHHDHNLRHHEWRLASDQFMVELAAL